MVDLGTRGRYLLAVLSAVAVAAAGNIMGAAPAAATSAGGLTVSVAYAENIGNSPASAATFPNPWSGAPNTIFLGSPNPQTAECGTATPCYDAGGIRLDNLGASPVTVDGTVVCVHCTQTGGKTYTNTWGSFTVPAGKSVILTENPPPPAKQSKYDNFDTSDTPHGNCTPVPDAPTIKFTIGGVATTLVDSTHVLDTHAIDSGACPSKRNESIQWRQIGATGSDSSSLLVNPPTATQFAGLQAGVTATLYDGSGVGLPNAAVNFTVASGPNAGQSGSVFTDANGNATFTYAGANEGEDSVVASTGVVGSFKSNQAKVLWTDDSASGWTPGDIGTPSPAGSSSFNASTGTWTLNGGGDIGGAADNFQFVYKNSSAGNGILTRVATQSNADPAAKAGPMLRANTSAGSPFYGAFATPGGGIQILDRSTPGGAVATVTSLAGGAPAYLWVVSSGSTFSTFTSSDGYTWTGVPGSAVTLNFGGAPLPGLAAASHNAAQLSQATFDTIAITATAPPPPPPVTCPAPWTCTDIGGPAAAGSAALSGGIWTIQGSGGDIHGSADQFQFVYQTLTGDGSISAHVTSQTNTSSWAKAGVMLRGSTAAGSPEYSLLVTPGNGIVVHYRTATGATTAKPSTLSGTVPAYLKVSRSGTVFSAYTSPDGITWNLVPNSTVTLAQLAGPILEGLADTSHNNGTLCTVTMDTVQPT